MITGKPVERKDLVDSESLQAFEIYKDSTVLLILRNLTMMLIGFAGFLRYDELSSLICEDVTVESRYLKITFQRSEEISFERSKQHV